MTRSHKLNDRDHAGLADGSAVDTQHLPRYFGKHGHVDADPRKLKKAGSGKANWGHPGDEYQDHNYVFTNGRRRSNSSTASHILLDFKTKFEAIEHEPVFEEELHGPLPDLVETEHDAVDKHEDLQLDLQHKQSHSPTTTISTESGNTEFGDYFIVKH